MNGTLIVAISGILLELIILAVVGVWAVGKIKSTTEVLTNTIKLLTGAVTKLEETISEIQKQLADHKAKIAVLESKTH